MTKEEKILLNKKRDFLIKYKELCNEYNLFITGYDSVYLEILSKKLKPITKIELGINSDLEYTWE